MVIVFLGSTNGLLSRGSTGTAVTEILKQENAGETSEAGDLFGYSLTSGDFDRIWTPPTLMPSDDLAVGVPWESYGGEANNGVVDIFYGSPAGLLPAVAQVISQSGLGGLDETGAHLGWALATGDFDNNGNDDLAVSAPDENFPGGITDAGAVYVREF